LYTPADGSKLTLGGYEMVKPLKVGVKLGTGVPPGYLWTVGYLSVASGEASKFLNAEQHAHAIDLVRSLASEEHPTHPKTVDVDAVEDFYELKDKGGILGKINLRIYFIIEPSTRQIIILSAFNKKIEDQMPGWLKIRVKNRLRRFRNGEFGSLL
jgi:hypothetical protein